METALTVNERRILNRKPKVLAQVYCCRRRLSVSLSLKTPDSFWNLIELITGQSMK